MKMINQLNTQDVYKPNFLLNIINVKSYNHNPVIRKLLSKFPKSNDLKSPLLGQFERLQDFTRH